MHFRRSSSDLIMRIVCPPFSCFRQSNRTLMVLLGSDSHLKEIRMLLTRISVGYCSTGNSIFVESWRDFRDIGKPRFS